MCVCARESVYVKETDRPTDRQKERVKGRRQESEREGNKNIKYVFKKERERQ